jgi:hypothetical protein
VPGDGGGAMLASKPPKRLPPMSYGH